jgi:hypothetical protein
MVRAATEGFGSPEFNQEGRIVQTDLGAFILFNVSTLFFSHRLHLIILMPLLVLDILPER